ncbi:hypothetical protein G7054_g11199 [Neopestalotiopsis clavispora]|nr:hypothetical protein G7054_g11199 [Neopestalotiopsis clavispora]
MEHVYEKVRDSTEGSSSLDSSEELGFISEHSKIKHKSSNSIRQRLSNMSARTMVETLMGGLIFVLLIIIASYHSARTKQSKSNRLPRFGPALPEKVVKFGNVAGFGPDLVYVDHEMMWNATHKRELHENWQALYPKSRGYITADPRPGDDFEYATPAYHLDGILEEGDHFEGYILSVYHQLHCLSIITQRMGTSYEEFAEFTRPQLEHTTHCIEYLRQAILCNADTSLEGETGAWPASAAWGQMHTCKDFDALLELADDRGMWDLSDARHPDLSKIHPDPAEVKNKYGGE